MHRHVRPVPIIVLIVLAAFGVARAMGARSQASAPLAIEGMAQTTGGARFRVSERAARAAGAEVLTPDIRAAGLRFAPGTGPWEQQAVRSAIAAARPEARTLIDLVDGLVEVRAGVPTRERAAGLMQVEGDGYVLTLDLAGVHAALGERGVVRLVLHELGHVVDHALVPAELDGALDAAIPRGIGCDEGVSGACAPRHERFAETFAKWAVNDIGVGIELGYKVPPPALSLWGEPLAQLAAQAG